MARRPSRRRTARTERRTLTIDRLGAAGDGLAGEVAVPFALPGETVDAEVTGTKARVTVLTETSPARAPAPCRHFGLPGDGCGGCKLQHLGEGFDTLWKAERLTAALSRAGLEAPPLRVSISAPRTRRRAKLAYLRTREGVRAGFRQLMSDRVVPLSECHLLAPELFDLALALSVLIGALPFRGIAEALITMTETGADVAVSGVEEGALGVAAREAAARIAHDLGLARLTVGGVPLAELAVPSLRLGGVPVALPTGAFLQATPEGQAALTEAVMAAAAGASSVADLYCGVGTFALPLSAGARILAAEGDAAAADALKRAAHASRRPVEVQTRDLATRPLQGAELADLDLVVLDPPRAGAAAQAAALAASAMPRIAYVSCDPATLARDLRTLSPRYHLSHLTLVDQFRWSPHIEAVAVLERR